MSYTHPGHMAYKHFVEDDKETRKDYFWRY